MEKKTYKMNPMKLYKLNTQYQKLSTHLDFTTDLK